ncbi:hypothetical protein KCM76_16790 [Zooshikella marina]|uniref:DUF7401 domain-containing protein n=1 Tax=Zooshikella ganghwensis TaxID=202772 RepID=UPI0004144390|nr:hypothetical protein [Zooshikella ganghwensis]MBU2707654.1 hypothetical protein [Zooshikella ganghwensis]
MPSNQALAAQLLASVAQEIEEAGDSTAPDWRAIYSMGWRTPADFISELLPIGLEVSNNSSSSPYHNEAFERLLFASLLQLMIDIREGRTNAEEGWQQVQLQLTNYMNSEQINGEAMMSIIGLLASLDLPMDVNFIDQTKEWQSDYYSEKVDHASELVTLEPQEALQLLLDEEAIQTEYDFYLLFAEQLTFIRDSILDPLLQSLLQTHHDNIREGTLLFLLHKQKEVRQTLLKLLQTSQYQRLVTPLGLRRLITIRNWIDKPEQATLDRIIRSIRKQGTPCAHYEVPEQANIEKVFSSAVDGAGAQSIVILCKEYGQYRLIGILLKEKLGIIDGWLTPLSSKRSCENIISHLRQEVYTLSISINYLQTVLPHFLALNSQSGQPLTAEVLMTLEYCGLKQWQPQPLDYQNIMANWQQEYPDIFTPTALQQAMRRNKLWVVRNFDSLMWFESDADIIKKAQHVLEEEHQGPFVSYLLEPYREKWQSRFIRLALWAANNSQKRGPKWQDFATLSWALNNETPLERISVFDCIAAESLAVAEDELYAE